MVSYALSGVQMRPRTNSGHSLSRFSVPLLPKPQVELPHPAAAARALVPALHGGSEVGQYEHEYRLT